MATEPLRTMYSPCKTRSISLLLVGLCLTSGLATASDQSAVGFTLPPDRALRAGFLIVDGVYNTELMAPWDVLQHVKYHSSPHPGVEVFAVALTDRPVVTAEGLRIVPDYTIENSPSLDILVVPSAENSRGGDRSNPLLIDWVRRAGDEASFVVSLCWGAFILAEAGLLDDHACTTFPGDYDTFAETFPHLDLRVNVSFVHQAGVLTSQGGARSYDVAMYLIDLLFGEKVARGVGGGLLIEWPPSPDTRVPFISDPRMQLPDRQLADQ